MTTARVVTCAVLFAAACYNPKFSVNTECGLHGECPNQGHCNAHNRCAPDDPDTGVDAGAGDDAGSGGAATDPICLGAASPHKICVDRATASVPASLSPTIDTDAAASRCLLKAVDPGSPGYTATPDVDACVIVVGDEISSSLTVTGSRPLILFSKTSLRLSATLSASGCQVAAGPAANPACSSGATPGTSFESGGGGAGGTFGAKGGTGGANASGSGGQPPSGVVLGMALRCGCPGAHGAGSGGGEPGDGGGAIALLAMDGLTIEGTINASGGAGEGGTRASDGAGGGGGGAGGMIVLDAGMGMVEIGPDGKCFANGGGGGGGGSTSAIGVGQPGTESDAPEAQGTGGPATDPGGDGGAGGLAALQDGQSGNMGKEQGSVVGSGGGGGGSVGVIKIFPSLPTDRARISPDPS